MPGLCQGLDRPILALRNNLTGSHCHFPLPGEDAVSSSCPGPALLEEPGSEAWLLDGSPFSPTTEWYDGLQPIQAAAVNRPQGSHGCSVSSPMKVRSPFPNLWPLATQREPTKHTLFSLEAPDVSEPAMSHAPALSVAPGVGCAFCCHASSESQQLAWP